MLLSLNSIPETVIPGFKGGTGRTRARIYADESNKIMHGLLHVNAPMWACRVVTLVPALIVLWFAKDPTQALVIGQVVLSIGIPFAVIPLMRYTHNKELMGKWADGTVKHVIFMIVVALIVALNVLLIVLTLMGRA